jgi:hypothetical protein
MAYQGVSQYIFLEGVFGPYGRLPAGEAALSISPKNVH